MEGSDRRGTADGWKLHGEAQNLAAKRMEISRRSWAAENRKKSQATCRWGGGGRRKEELVSQMEKSQTIQGKATVRRKKTGRNPGNAKTFSMEGWEWSCRAGVND